jgi:hypothetical protein
MFILMKDLLSPTVVHLLLSLTSWKVLQPGLSFFVYAIWDKEKFIILIDISNVSVGRWKLIKLFGFHTMHEDIWNMRDGRAAEWKKQQNEEFHYL